MRVLSNVEDECVCCCLVWLCDVHTRFISLSIESKTRHSVHRKVERISRTCLTVGVVVPRCTRAVVTVDKVSARGVVLTGI